MDLQQALLQAREKRYRAIVLLEGDELWLKRSFRALRVKLGEIHSVVLSDSAITWSEPPQGDVDSAFTQLPSRHFKKLLGTESPILAWDLTTPMNHDALAASSGVINGGGVLIVLSTKHRNNDGRNNKAKTNDLKPSEQRIFGNFVKHHDIVALNSDNFDQALADLSSITEAELADPERKHLHLNTEQLNCVERIKHAATGHKNRPVVIRADRGRGKSTALGVAIGQLVSSEPQRKVIVVTDQKVGVSVLHNAFKNAINEPQFEDALSFWPSDALIDRRPKTDLLVIDEAATLPLNSLEQLILHYPRLVLASTMHGYEGSGRGFDIKLSGVFKSAKKTPRYETLSKPIRWGEQDPLEQLINSTFILDANLFDGAPSSNGLASELCKPSGFQSSEFRWVDQHELANNEPLLRSVFALLVLAHYQTRPSDLAHLLDDSDLSIGILYSDDNSAHSPKVLAVTLCVNEAFPELNDLQLHEQIISGERRLRGKLVPQALAMFYNDPAWLHTKLLRVMRIVVRSEFQQHGLGSLLLDQVLKKAKEERYDGCSVSFGVEADLVRFWGKNNYQPLRLSYRSDASSGLPSLMMVCALNDKTKQRITAGHPHFYSHLLEGLKSYYLSLSSEALISILSHQSLSSLTPVINESQREKLKRYVNSAYAQWDCWLELRDLALAACSQRNTTETNDAQQLLDYVVRLKQHHELMPNAGKKAWDHYLREACGRLLSSLDNEKTGEDKN